MVAGAPASTCICPWECGSNDPDPEPLSLDLHAPSPFYTQAIGEDLFAIAVDQPFRFPAAFTFVLRAFSTLEGLGKALDPEYKFADMARPYVLELLELEVRPGGGHGLGF